jgi:DNA-binding NarL/FixJ family response regulator
MLDGLKIILESHNDLTVIGTCRDGTETLELVDKLQPDLVLLDIRMPDINGVECTKIIKEKYSNIVVLILTTFDDDEYIVDALKYGASGYLLKDIKGERLIQAVIDAYKGEMIMPSKVAFKLAQKVSNEMAKNSKPKNILDLSGGEREVAVMLSQGFSNKQMAAALFLSEGTIKNYVSNIYNKIGISDRANAVLFLKDQL